MKVVRVDRQGAKVDRWDELRLVQRSWIGMVRVPREKKPVLYEVANLAQLVLLGNVQLTAPAVGMLLQHGVDVVFLSNRNRFRGRLASDETKLARMRHAQLLKMGDEKASLEMARAVVVGKLTNQRTLLQRQLQQASSPVAVARLTKGVKGIANNLAGAKRAGNADILRGFEGKGAADYFGGWRVLVPPGFKFAGRAFYPPPDPVNSMLSFGYSLLTKDVTTAVQLAGLDPYLGFFHTIYYGRVSLALDVMEEFRPIVVDGMVLEWLNRGQIKPDNFRWTGKASPKGIRSVKAYPVLLDDEARKLLLRRYDERLEMQVFHPVAGQKMSYREGLEYQVQQVARVVLGEIERYQAMTIR